MAFFEVKLKRIITDKKGNGKEIKETFLVENAVSFGDAESAVLSYWGCECEITAVSISKIIEVINCPSQEEKENLNVFRAILSQIFTDDSGEEKVSKYRVVLWAKDLVSAMEIVKNYIKQGYDDMSIISINKSNIVEVI